jgi:hypothetical protein
MVKNYQVKVSTLYQGSIMLCALKIKNILIYSDFLLIIKKVRKISYEH